MTTVRTVLGPTFGPNGLVPVVVQDESDRRVLMVAYTDVEALAATIATGEMHFHSRSRGRLWRKGETSGNTLHVVGLEMDCDGDAILASVRPHGPTCHRGTRSCFDPADAGIGDGTGAGPAAAEAGGPAAAEAGGPPAKPETQGFVWLEAIWATIDERRRLRPAGSYTSSLLDGGVDVAGRKVTEEATEMLMAAKDDAAAEGTARDRSATTAAFTEEAADLLYHALVLIAERGQKPMSVLDVLKARHAQ